MFVFDNNKYDDTQNETNYTPIIKEFYGSLVLELGKITKPIPKTPKKTEKNNFINVRGVKKELLEYHYGIYRMFPCGKQHRYHMQYIHVPGVTERRIIG